MSAEKTVKLFRENMLQEAAKEGFYRNKGKGSSGDFKFVWVTPEGTESSFSTEYVEEQYMDPGAWTGDWQEPSGDVKDGILRYYAQRYGPADADEVLKDLKGLYTHTGPTRDPEEFIPFSAARSSDSGPGSGGDVSPAKKKKKVKRRRRRAGVRFTGAGTKALRGGGIKVLQQLLFALGFGGKNEKKFVDGINGPNTLKALRAFQKTHKKPNGAPLQVDGVVGKNSAPALLDAAEGGAVAQDERDDVAIAQWAAKARAPRGAPSTAAQRADLPWDAEDEAMKTWEAWLARQPDPEVGRLPVGGVDPKVQKRMQDRAFPPGSAGYKSWQVLGDDRFIPDDEAAAAEKQAAFAARLEKEKKYRDMDWDIAEGTLQRRNKKMVNQEQLRELIKEAIAEADLDLLELYKTQHKAQGKINEKVKYFWEDDDEDEEETSAEIEAAVDKGGRAKEKKFRPRSPTGGDTVDLKKSHDKLASAFRGGSHSLADDDSPFVPFKPKDDIAHAMVEPPKTRKKRRRARGVRFAGRKAKKSVFGVEGLQELLFGLGFGGDDPEKFVDGKNGPSTLRALIAFQKTQKKPNGKPLKADGVVGSNTAKALNRAVDVGADEVVASQDADDLAQLATTLNAEDDAKAADKAAFSAEMQARDRQREFAKRKKAAPAVAKLPGSPGATGVTAESLRKDLLEEACGVPAKRYRIKRR